MPPLTSLFVAVVGAGAAGLVAARELSREGHEVVVFEREDQVGGTWVYREEVDSDPLGIDPSRIAVPSSLYSSLRTNLPRELMGFSDYPFVSRGDGSGDPRRYPGHREVLMYLKEFGRVFGVEEMVRFEVEVVKVWLEENNKWKVMSKRKGDGVDVMVEEVFDAVVVCNGGRYYQPRIAHDIPGIRVWPGKQIHSHNYRNPEPFRDQVVVLIGNSVSGQDISREIAGVVREVHVASRSNSDTTYEKLPSYDNVWLHSMIESANEDGSVVFRNGIVVFADVILHCTGWCRSPCLNFKASGLQVFCLVELYFLHKRRCRKMFKSFTQCSKLLAHQRDTLISYLIHRLSTLNGLPQSVGVLDSKNGERK